MTQDVSSPAEPTAPPPPDPARRSTRKVWTIFAAVVVPVLIIANVVTVKAVLGDDPGGGETASDDQVIAASGVDFEMVESSSYEYAEPLLDLDPTAELTFPAHYDADGLMGFSLANAWGHAIRVFIDPGLTVEVDGVADVDYVPGDEEFVVRPPPWSGVSAYNPQVGGMMYLSRPGAWGLSDEYFVVEYLDQDTGAELERPLVTRFTVAMETPRPEAASFEVDEDGVGHFAWTEVEGASNYYVIRIGGRRDIELIGMTADTTWSTIEQDEDVQEALAELAEDREASGVLEQNRALRQYTTSEDELRDQDTLDVEAAELTPLTIGVLAVVGSETSAMTIAATGDDTGALPEGLAYNAATELGVFPRDVETVDQIPTHIPVTTADGRTVLRTVILELDDMWEDATATADRPITRIPFRVDGTLLRGVYSFDRYDEATFLAELEAVVERNAQARERTGAGQSYTYVAEAWTLDEDAISRAAPDVPYQVNATNSFTAYLAANLLAGNEFIDVSAYVDNPAGIGLYDALDEAVYQNPLIGRIDVHHYASAEQVLAIRYAYDSHESLVAEQEAVAAEVARIIEDVITDGMSDREKVQAINDHIRGIATYNYDALEQVRNGRAAFGETDHPRAWSPAGILLDGTAVCKGYADVFKVLADAAGLDSVVVLGPILRSGELHAWNKVSVDGAWRMIDVTWNDVDSAPNEFFLLTDEESAETRIQDNSWIVDSLVGNYAAH